MSSESREPEDSLPTVGGEAAPAADTTMGEETATLPRLDDNQPADNENTTILPPTSPSEANEPATGVERKRPKWLIPAASAAAVVLVLAGCGTAYGVVTHNEQPKYEQTVKTADTAFDKLKTALKTAQNTLSTVKPEQVKDAKTLDALKKVVKRAQALEAPDSDVNQWLLWELKQGETTLTTAQQQATSMVKQLTSSVEAVDASKAAKELDDAKNTLKSKLDEVKQTLTDSSGKVADENTRTNLQKLIDEAGKLSSTNPKDYTDKATALGKAADQVNASVQAKADADAKAAAEAAAAAQAQANRSTSSSSSNTYRRNTGSSGGGTYYRNTTGKTNNGYKPSTGGGKAPTGNGSGSGCITSSGWNWCNDRDSLGTPTEPADSDCVIMHTDGTNTPC